MRRAKERRASKRSARRARSRAASRKRARSASTHDSQSVISIPDESESEDSWMAAQRRVDERKKREAEAEEEKLSRFYESPDSHE